MVVTCITIATAMYNSYIFIALNTYVGLFSVTGPVYVSEMAPSRTRGKLGLVNFLMTGAGIFSATVAAGLFSIDSQHAYTFGWRFGTHTYYMIIRSCSYICVSITHCSV